MDLLNIEDEYLAANIRLTTTELAILKNALNEVCNGLDQFEFETRMGSTHEEVESLLMNVGSMLQELKARAT